MTDPLDTLRPEVKDPNPLATAPTKWRAEHCVTHHHACDCREWEHATRVAELEGRAEKAEAELAAVKARIAEAPVVYLTSKTGVGPCNVASMAHDVVFDSSCTYGKSVRVVLDE